MEEIDLSQPSPSQGDGKKNAERERAPAVVVFTSTNTLWATFALIYVVSFLNCLVGTVVLSLTPYVMSHFSGHSTLSILTMLVRILSGVLRLPMAKYIDEFGRARGFLLAASLTVLGVSIQPLAQSLATAVFAQVLHGVGWNCLDYVLTVILADMTSLKNRTLVYGIYVTPMLVTSFAAPSIAEQLYFRFGWSAIFAFSGPILFATCIPFGVVLLYTQRRGGSGSHETSGNSTTRRQPSRLKRFAVELDLPGVCLAIAALCLFLLPLTHPPGTQDGWPVRTFAVMLVLGIFTMIGFTIWESALAPATCIPWRLSRDRNVLGGCLVVMFSVASAACWSSYYGSYLQVVHDETITTAGYLLNSNPFTFALSAPFIGLLISMTGNYKSPAFLASPLLGLFTGLLLVFHGPDAGSSALAVCQVFIGFSMRLFVACSQMAVMANIEHKDVALAVGVWGTFLSIAVAIGSGNSGAIWTRTVPAVLEHALPSDSKNLTEEIAGSLVKQIQYPIGSPARDAVIAAYWAAQEQMVILAVCLVPVAFACIFMWRNIDVRKSDDRENMKERGVIW